MAMTNVSSPFKGDWRFVISTFTGSPMQLSDYSQDLYLASSMLFARQLGRFYDILGNTQPFYPLKGS